MNRDDNDVDTEKPHSSTPMLPKINPGYDTPDSDYNYEVVKLQNKSNQDVGDKFIPVPSHAPTDVSSIRASSIASDSDDKDSHFTESIQNDGAYTYYSQSEHSSIQRKPSKVANIQRKSQRRGSHTSSQVSSQGSFKEAKSSGISDSNPSSIKSNNTRLQKGPVNRKVSIDEGHRKDCSKNSKVPKSVNSSANLYDNSNNKVIRSCTYAEGYGSHKKESTMFPMVNQSERGSKSAKELGLVFDQGFNTPVITSANGSARSRGAETEERYMLESPFRFSLADSKSVTRQSSSVKHKTAWCGPRISLQRYNNIKERLLKEGKFKELLRQYWGLDVQEKINRPDSDDDGYDTDLDSNLGKFYSCD